MKIRSKIRAASLCSQWDYKISPCFLSAMYVCFTYTNHMGLGLPLQFQSPRTSFARPGGVYLRRYQTSAHRELMTEEVRQSLQGKTTNSTRGGATGEAAHSSLDSEGPVSSSGQRMPHCFLGDHGATP